MPGGHGEDVCNNGAVIGKERVAREAFEAGLPEPLRGALDARAEAALARAAARGREAWPTVPFEDELWLGHLARRLREDEPLATQLDAIDAGGLYLAAACLRGVHAALEAFEREVLPSARRALSMRADEARVDEMLQRTRTRLLTELHGPPKLALYAGRGPLGGFVRTVAVHLLANDEAAAKPIEDDDDALAALPEAADVEAGLCRLDQQQHFRAAFREALATLSSRDRALLRLSLLDGLSIDDIAPMYGAHRATVARWLGAARDLLATRTRQALASRLRLRPDDLESLLGGVLSRFDLSLSRLLRESHGAEAPPDAT
ncbi:sigma factor-like helix-turn-helix DNA-binding protein [Polyangium sorediatum]|uniref:Sigma factor-like helix-turn-helix DNA-binding protein n=1 Tax=Polyangium sorediatum TaxID=889274 RepID=A0ABT6P7H5_9BACT|nr:sigma factor-like helix-turn-helix DNA-binding protein [Polyangium sorediatum]MDI1436574.1 sigma factor-like helix-turn-helix DNA-binding protein [Polyangium sorediatum]